MGQLPRPRLRLEQLQPKPPRLPPVAALRLCTVNAVPEDSPAAHSVHQDRRTNTRTIGTLSACKMLDMNVKFCGLIRCPQFLGNQSFLVMLCNALSWEELKLECYPFSRVNTLFPSISIHHSGFRTRLRWMPAPNTQPTPIMRRRIHIEPALPFPSSDRIIILPPNHIKSLATTQEWV